MLEMSSFLMFNAELRNEILILKFLPEVNNKINSYSELQFFMMYVLKYNMLEYIYFTLYGLYKMLKKYY